MTKKVTAAILALVMCFALVSCKAAIKEDPEDFEFKEVAGIPLADIKIAYVHAEETGLLRDLEELCEKEPMLERELLKLDISERESYGGIMPELLARGYNVFFLDAALPEEFTATLFEKTDGVYFISHGNAPSAAEGLVSFEDNFLEYAYLLGVIAAESYGGESIGVLTDSFEYFPSINAFAAGVRLVNSNIKVIASERVQTLTQNDCEAIFIPNGASVSLGNAKAMIYGFDSDKSGAQLHADYSEFFEKCIASVCDGTFKSGSVSLGAQHGSMDDSLKALGLSEELNEKVQAIKKYFVDGMPVFSDNQLMISGDKVISIHEIVMDNRGNTVIDENGNYYYYSENDLLCAESYEDLIGGKMNYFLSNVELK